MIRRAGFTLLELLLVLVLISIIASVVVVNFSQESPQEHVDKEALRFQQVFEFIADMAQLRQQEWGLVVSPNSYAFVYLSESGWQWVNEPVAAQRYQLPAALQLQLELEGLPGTEYSLLSQLAWPQDSAVGDPSVEVPPPLPSVFILSSGEISPFRVVFSAESERALYQIELGTDFGLPLKRYELSTR